MKRLIAAVCAGLLGLAALASSARAGPDEGLWRAIVAVESGGDAHAYNPRDGATGIAQIRTVCVADVNRIARRQGLDVRFSLADRRNPALARRMWTLYLDYYGRVYERLTGRPATREVLARIWNGGPDGWRKSSTRGYWQRVREALQGLPGGSAAAQEAPAVTDPADTVS